MGTLTTFRFVPHYRALDYCRVGWMPAVIATLCHHDDYSVLMTWPCACEPVEPTCHAFS